MSKLTLTAARNSLLSTFELAQRRRIQITIACLFALWVSVPATAQQTMGDILGTVTDTSGAAVPGAQVTVTNTGTQIERTTTAGASGAT